MERIKILYQAMCLSKKVTVICTNEITFISQLMQSIIQNLEVKIYTV